MSDLAIYDAAIMHNWMDRLKEILKWLSLLAHNMIRGQSEHNFEQQQIIKRTNILLLQTLFADRDKMKASVCELLVGLNYICQYEHQQHALLDYINSFNFKDCMEWQLQLGASFNSGSHCWNWFRTAFNTTSTSETQTLIMSASPGLIQRFCCKLLNNRDIQENIIIHPMNIRRIKLETEDIAQIHIVSR